MMGLIGLSFRVREMTGLIGLSFFLALCLFCRIVIMLNTKDADTGMQVVFQLVMTVLDEFMLIGSIIGLDVWLKIVYPMTEAKLIQFGNHYFGLMVLLGLFVIGMGLWPLWVKLKRLNNR